MGRGQIDLKGRWVDSSAVKCNLSYAASQIYITDWEEGFFFFLSLKCTRILLWYFFSSLNEYTLTRAVSIASLLSPAKDERVQYVALQALLTMNRCLRVCNIKLFCKSELLPG